MFGRKRKNPRCGICNKRIDRSACNEDFTIITIVRDQGNATHRLRSYLCDNHTPKLEVFLATEEMKFYGMEVENRKYEM